MAKEIQDAYLGGRKNNSTCDVGAKTCAGENKEKPGRKWNKECCFKARSSLVELQSFIKRKQ